MIGTIAGDIIGSPYVKSPLEDSTRIFFNPFESKSDVELSPGPRGKRAVMHSYEAHPTGISSLTSAVADWFLKTDGSRDALLGVLDARGMEGGASLGPVLAACIPVVRLSDSLDGAVRDASLLVAALRPASEAAGDMKAATDLVRAAWAVRSAPDMAGGLSAAKAVLEGEGYDLSRGSSEQSLFLRGTVQELAPGRLAPGEGKAVRDPELVFPAVYAVLKESSSWEEAVRRGVALGGDSSLSASLAGGIAAMKWDIPEQFSSRTLDYLSAEDRSLAASYGKAVTRSIERARGPKEDRNVVEDMFSVIRMEGMGSVYVIPEDREDMMAAVRALNRRLGRSEKRGEYSIISPEKLPSELGRLSAQLSGDGSPLDGTYIEHPRPEVRHLWLQDAQIRTAYTRTGEGVNGRKLPAASTRQETFNAFKALQAHAEAVRTELERRAGFSLAEVFADKATGAVMEYRDRLMDGEGWNESTSDIFNKVRNTLSSHVADMGYVELYEQVVGVCDGEPWMDGFVREMDALRDEVASLEGRHLHFASAFYPVVKGDSIEIREGDTLRARVHVDDDGRFQVDTNAKTGGVQTEGIDGVLATMNLISLPKPASPSDRPLSDVSKMDVVREALSFWCLDEGRIEDEKEREALEEDDAGKVYDEARAVRRKYRSNVEKAIDDMGLEMSVAVMPAGPVLTGKAKAAREERRAESEERYAGLDRQGALDSQAHKGSIFTIGHSNLKQEEFDALLKRHGIEVLVDVRSYPKSRFCPHFNKDTLSGHLEGNGVEYHYFPELGGHQFEGEGKERRELSYEECIAREEFQKGLRSVRECAKEGYRVALMCSEGDPMDCHRMVMLGRALAHPEIYDGRLKPMDVQHITRMGYTLDQGHFERKMMKDYGLSDSPAEDRSLASSADLGVSSKDVIGKMGEAETQTERRIGAAVALHAAVVAGEMKDVGTEATSPLKPASGGRSLDLAYEMRGKYLLEKGAANKAISLKRNMLSRQAKEDAAWAASYRRGGRRK